MTKVQLAVSGTCTVKQGKQSTRIKSDDISSKSFDLELGGLGITFNGNLVVTNKSKKFITVSGRSLAPGDHTNYMEKKNRTITVGMK